MKTAEEILDKHLDALGICCDRETGFIDDYGVYPIIENAMEEYANQSKWIDAKVDPPKDTFAVIVGNKDTGVVYNELHFYSRGDWYSLITNRLNENITHYQKPPQFI